MMFIEEDTRLKGSNRAIQSGLLVLESAPIDHHCHRSVAPARRVIRDVSQTTKVLVLLEGLRGLGTLARRKPLVDTFGDTYSG
jgi:hypothetical protein